MIDEALENAAPDVDLSNLARVKQAHDRLRTQLARIVVGQDEVIDQLMIAIFARGHCILEGVPGLAKTLMVSTLADCLSLKFNRIQFTPDLMPSDITGTEMLQEDRSTGARAFRYVPGPVFANILLADEINRTPPKTQAALLEAMQERQVSSAARGIRCPIRSSCWPRKIRSSRKGRIRCPRPSWTASCSRCLSAILRRTKSG